MVIHSIIDCKILQETIDSGISLYAYHQSPSYTIDIPKTLNNMLEHVRDPQIR
jgi:hypothetical protein